MPVAAAGCPAAATPSDDAAAGHVSGPAHAGAGATDGYPRTQSWQMQSPAAGYPDPPATSPYAGQVPYPRQQPVYPHASLAEAHQASEAAEQQTPIDEIRASLREFREAVRELTESRSRRRYF